MGAEHRVRAADQYLWRPQQYLDISELLLIGLRSLTPKLPLTMIVGARVDGIISDGRLHIGVTSLTLVRTGWIPTSSPPFVTHVRPTVLVLFTTIGPPWANTHVIIEGEKSAGVATLPIWRRAQVLEALRGTEFTVHARRVWFSFGGSYIR
jgi:hypothetical protein